MFSSVPPTSICLNTQKSFWKLNCCLHKMPVTTVFVYFCWYVKCVCIRLFLHSSKTHLSLIKIAVRDETFVVSSRCRRLLSLLTVVVEDLPFVVSSWSRSLLPLLIVDVEDLPFVVSSRCLLYCWILRFIWTTSLQHSHKNIYNMSLHKFQRLFCKPYSYRFKILSFSSEVKDWLKQN